MSAFDLDDILDSALDEYEQDQVNAAKAAESSAANAATSAVVELEPSASAATATAAAARTSLQQQQAQPSAAAAASMNSALSATDAEILRDPTKFADELKSLMSELGASGSGLPAEDAEPMMKTLQQLIHGLQNLPDGAGPDFAAFAAAAAAAENKASSSSSSSTLPATAAASAAKASSSSASAATPAVSLEQSLEQMMQAVSQGAKSAGAASNAPPNLGDMDMSQMDEMLKTLMAGMGESNDGDAAGGNGAMDKMMADMMSKMFSKAILMEPIKAITAKYPDWIAANRGKHTPEAFAMFDKQFDCFSRLSVELDKPGEDTTNVMALMQEMQSYGNPPQEILDGLMPGPGGAGGFPFGDMMGGAGAGAGAGEMPPIPPELLNEMQNLDPSKVKEMQDACKTQ